MPILTQMQRIKVKWHGMTTESRKIGSVTENHANQIIPLCRASQSLAIRIQLQNCNWRSKCDPNRTKCQQRQNSKILSINSITKFQTADNSIIMPNVTECKRQTESFKAFCSIHSLQKLSRLMIATILIQTYKQPNERQRHFSRMPIRMWNVFVTTMFFACLL